MLIELEVKQYERAVLRLMQLDSAFPDRPTTVIGHNPNQIAKEIFNRVEDWRGAAGIQESETSQARIVKRTGLAEDDYIEKIIGLIQRGFTFAWSGEFKLSEKAFGEALKRQQLNDDLASQHVTLGYLHTVLVGRLLQQESDAVLDDLETKLNGVRQASASVSRRFNSGSVDRRAYEVNLGEVGVSEDEPIGVSNLYESVCIAIKSDAGHVALLVVGAFTKEDSIAAFLDEYSSGRASVRLFGARGESKQLNTSLTKVLRALAPRDIEVISADLLDLAQPISFVVDPRTFEVFQRLPGKTSSDRGFTAVVAGFLKSDSVPLRLAFDLTGDGRRDPIQVPLEVEKKIRHLLDLTDRELYESRMFEKMEEEMLPADFAVHSETFIVAINAISDVLTPLVRLKGKPLTVGCSETAKAYNVARQSKTQISQLLQSLDVPSSGPMSFRPSSM